MLFELKYLIIICETVVVNRVCVVVWIAWKWRQWRCGVGVALCVRGCAAQTHEASYVLLQFPCDISAETILAFSL